jgi:chloramphenicol-sensitive protein RarD
MGGGIPQVASVDRSRMGVCAALAAFLLWGILPVFWKMLDFLPAATIVAQRTLWSLVLLVAILGWRGEGRGWLAGLRSPRIVGWHLVSGVLLASNWLLYVWSTLNGHIVDAALGYYLNPFFNMLFGALWFGEKNRRLQNAAILLALGGVLLQVPSAGKFPWIAVTLALTFSLYAVVRKRSKLAALEGLTVETSLLAPFALGWLLWRGGGPAAAFGGSFVDAGLVVLTGFATALPLLFFAYAARNLRLTTLGMLQFLGPTLQFFIGWKLYGEAVTSGRLISFGMIWLSIGIYVWDALRGGGRDSA